MQENNSIKDIVLSLFFVFEDIFGRTKIQKLLFLLEQQIEIDMEYAVKHYGPFSDVINGTVDTCVSEGLLEEKKVLTRYSTWGYHYFITEKGIKIAKKSFSKLDSKLQQKLKKLCDEFKDFSATDLVKFVYNKYPAWVPEENY